LQLVAHVLDLVPNIPDQRSPPLNLINLEPKAVGVVFHGFDALDQVFEVLAELLQRLFELASCFAQLGTVR
jgi:hypothetical protein